MRRVALLIAILFAPIGAQACDVRETEQVDRCVRVETGESVPCWKTSFINAAMKKICNAGWPTVDRVRVTSRQQIVGFVTPAELAADILRGPR